MKKILTMLVAFMLLFTVVACGNNENSENSTTEKAGNSNTTDSSVKPVKENDKTEAETTTAAEETTTDAATEPKTEETTTEPQAEFTPLEDGNWYYVYPEEGYDYYNIEIISFSDKGYDLGMAEAASESDALGNDIILYNGVKYHITDFGGEGYGIEYTDNGDTIEIIISGDCHMTLSRTADNQLTVTSVDEESGFKTGTVYER